MNEYDEINATKWTYDPPLPERRLSDRWMVLYVGIGYAVPLIDPDHPDTYSFDVAMRHATLTEDRPDHGLVTFVEHESRVDDGWYPGVW